MKYIFSITVIIYLLVMFIVSSLYHTTVMNPLQFLWAFFYFLIGPSIVIYSIIIIIKKLLKRPISKISLKIAIIGMILVMVWTFGFWAISRITRPILFSFVVDTNKLLAESAMQKYPEKTRFRISGFRYPFFPLESTLAYHENKAFFLFLPGAPSPMDKLIYDPGKSFNHSRDIHLVKNWYFQSAKVGGKWGRFESDGQGW